LVLDVVERVRHEDAIEIREWPWLFHKIAAVRADPYSSVFRRNVSESHSIDIHRVNDASRREHARERTRERTVAAPQIRPGRRPEAREAAVGEHRGRIVYAHDVQAGLRRSRCLVA
jgi:hypothetical protein